jgi:FKBP-type peptidyl-prolyl cis-trans isomerase FklB
MKSFRLAAVVAALPVLSLVTASVLAATPAPAPMDDDSKVSYALGYQLGRDLGGTVMKPDAVVKGLEDGRAGAPPKLTQQEMETALAALQHSINTQRQLAQAEAAKKVAAAGTAYLAENAKKPGVVTTKSGLQYRIVTPGTGPTPKATDTVTVHYRGTLVDGTEFDSSYQRNQPATFPVTGVIAGWTEALQLMKEGSKFELVIPPALAYADQGPLANQVLLFEVELIKVEAGAAANPAPAK